MKWLLALLFTLPLIAQEAPVVTDLQRLQVQVVLKDLEIAQLKAQAAQRDFDAAREKLTVLTRTLQVDGFTLDLQTFSYTKNPESQK